MNSGSGFDRLVAACAAVRTRAAATSIATAITVAAGLVLLLSLLPESVREGRGSIVPLGLALGLWSVVLAGLWGGRRVWASMRPDAVAEEADDGAGLGAGDVRAALELGSGADRPGSALAALHQARISEQLSKVAVARLLPASMPRWTRRARRAIAVGAGSLVLLLVAGWARPQPTLSAAVALSAPWRTAFPEPLPPLGLQGQTGVPRGEPSVLGVSAIGRDSVTLVWRAAGEVIQRRMLSVSTQGQAEGRTTPIDSPTRIWIEDDSGFSSDTLLVRPLEPLLVQDLQVVLEYPAYLGRPAETHRGQVPPLVAPEGTRIQVSGETNLALDSGRLVFETEPSSQGASAADVVFEIDVNRFGASWAPRRTGTWLWDLEATGSIGSPITPDPIRVLVVADLPPRVELLYPAADTTLGFEKVMPLVVDVEDDIGLRSVAIRSWRSGLGSDLAEHREALAPGPAGSRRAVFRHLLDRSADELLPGDTVFYQFEAFDGRPGRGAALSEVFTLRVPTFAETRQERAEDTEALADAAQDLEDAMQALAQAAADAARRTEAESADSEEARFDATEEARSVLEDAERADEELSALEDDLAAMREELAESPMSDPALAEQLERLAERYEELAEQGLSTQLEELAEALQDLDPEAVRAALEELAQNSEELREQLEQTLGMLEQAALEQAMKSAQANADELADQQRDLSQETDAEAFQENQAALAERAQELAQQLEELEQELSAGDREMAADSAAAAAERTEQAIQNMEQAQQEAGQQAGQQEGQQAGQQGEVSEGQQQAAEQAAEALEQAASALGSAEQEMSGQTGEAAAQTLARARNEALALAEEEGRLAEATRGDQTSEPEDWRAEQNAVRQGLENLLERVSNAGNEAAMLDQATGAAAGEAAEQMDQLLERLAEDGARRLPSRAEAENVQNSLNELAQNLLAAEQAAQAAGEQSSGQEAAEQMAQLAQQQQGVTQETSSLLMPGPKPAGQERTQEQLARQQQEIAEELGEMEDPEGELLGRPEELAEEAASLARQLELEGPTQETLERQRRLFKSMLDAGRSLEDEDLDPNRRESEAGRAAPREPPAIDPDLIRGRRFPLPPESALRELPIFYRALIFDYFDRLNRPKAPPPDPAPRERE